METEDMVVAAVKFAGGALGTIDATTAAYPGFAERIEIIGEKATATLAGSDLVVAHHDGRLTEMKTDYGAGGTGADPMAFPNDWHRAAIADFLDSLDERREPVISGREALKVHRLIDALLEAGRTCATVMVAN
jgi:predicted dehydrogenase